MLKGKHLFSLYLQGLLPPPAPKAVVPPKDVEAEGVGNNPPPVLVLVAPKRLPDAPGVLFPKLKPDKEMNEKRVNTNISNLKIYRQTSYITTRQHFLFFAWSLFFYVFLPLSSHPLSNVLHHPLSYPLSSSVSHPPSSFIFSLSQSVCLSLSLFPPAL